MSIGFGVLGDTYALSPVESRPGYVWGTAHDQVMNMRRPTKTCGDKIRIHYDTYDACIEMIRYGDIFNAMNASEEVKEYIITSKLNIEIRHIYVSASHMMILLNLYPYSFTEYADGVDSHKLANDHKYLTKLAKSMIDKNIFDTKFWSKVLGHSMHGDRDGSLQ